MTEEIVSCEVWPTRLDGPSSTGECTYTCTYVCTCTWCCKEVGKGLYCCIHFSYENMFEALLRGKKNQFTIIQYKKNRQSLIPVALLCT